MKMVLCQMFSLNCCIQLGGETLFAVFVVIGLILIWILSDHNIILQYKITFIGQPASTCVYAVCTVFRSVMFWL